jgi:hypothetical protein
LTQWPLRLVAFVSTRFISRHHPHPKTHIKFIARLHIPVVQMKQCFLTGNVGFSLDYRIFYRRLPNRLNKTEGSWIKPEKVFNWAGDFLIVLLKLSCLSYWLQYNQSLWKGCKGLYNSWYFILKSYNLFLFVKLNTIFYYIIPGLLEKKHGS